MTPSARPLAILLCALAACSAPGPAPLTESAADRAVAADPGVLLTGRVATLNDAGEVIDGGRVWIRGGRIEAVLRRDQPLPPGSAGARNVDTGGTIYPGLIDIHNHPEYNLFPVMPITRRYRDRYEWRWYDDDYQKRISAPNIVLGSKDFYDLGMDVGRYGELMALAAGTTSLQGGGGGAPSAGSIEVGGRHFRPYAQPGCLARNVETEVEVGAARSWVDMGRDVPEWQRQKADAERGPFILHLAEGTSARMADEFRFIKNSGLLGPNLVVVHGVALGRDHYAEMAKAGARLAWSPLSNYLLYGATADVRAAREAGVPISLSPDWAPSGSKSLLGELKVADLVNRQSLGGLFSDVDLVRMATRQPAAALGWDLSLGQIAPGFLADLVVIDSRHADPYRNLIEATEANVRATVVRGEVLYGDWDLLRQWRGSEDGLEEFRDLAPRKKAFHLGCQGVPAATLYAMSGRLAHALKFEPEVTLRLMKGGRIAEEMKRCPGEAPPAAEPTSEDAARLLRCRFGLPFEPTALMKLTAKVDEDYWKRVLANPNLPAFLKALPDYYR